MTYTSVQTFRHAAQQIAQLDRLADLYHELGQIDKAAGLMFEASLIRASSAGAAIYTPKGQPTHA